MERNGKIGTSDSLLNPTPLDLDYLIHTLRNPTPHTTVQNVLGYIYHYIPYVKVEHNLRVIFSSFLNSPVCFGTNVPSYEDNYLVVEVFKLITDKKLKVSQPTLSIKTYYDVLLKELKSFVLFDPLRNSWKVMPILSGLWLSNGLRDQLYTDNNIFKYKWFFHDWDQQSDLLFKKCLQNSLFGAAHPEVVNLCLLSFALKYNKGENLSDYLGKIQRTSIISRLTELVFGFGGSGACKYTLFAQTNPNDPNWDQYIKKNILQKPVVKHLNRLAVLLKSLLTDLPYNDENFQFLMNLVSSMLDFNRDINHFTASHPLLNVGSESFKDEDSYQAQYLLLMKGYLFFEVIVFQGILSRFVSSKNVSLVHLLIRSRKYISHIEYEYCEISQAILHSLYYLNFILMTIGQGGFDAFNFVYYVCLEVCLQNNRGVVFENFTQFLIGNYKEVNLHHDALNRNYVVRCKVLFVLGLWENYLQTFKEKDARFVDFLYDTTIDLARDPYIEDHALVEAAHSVLLVYFTNKDNTTLGLGQVLHYFEILANQFPDILSANQLSVAVETLGKKILSAPIIYGNDSFYRASTNEFLECVFFKCQNTMPGNRIEKASETFFSSAQPIQEIEAASTMSQLNNNDPEQTNIVKVNKAKKPKDLPDMKLHPSSNKNAQQHFTKREIPATSREAIIVAFLNTIPYLPLNIFVHWLDKIWSLILSSNQDERAYLTDKLWYVLSKNLDLNRCEIAYSWWYETKRAVEENFGHANNSAKL